MIFGQSAELLDSLKNGIAQNEGKDKIPYLDELAWQLMFSRTRESLDHALESMAIAEESGDSSLVANSSNTLGACYIKLGEYDKALKANRRALRIRKGSGTPRDIGSSLSKIGMIFQEQSRLDSAIPYQIEALKFLEEAGDSAAIAQTYLNLSSIFEMNKDLDKALDYAQKARDLCKSLGFKYGLAGSLGNVSMLLEKQEKYSEARQVGEEALELFRELNSRGDIATQLNNLGSIERNLGRNKEGLQRYEEALDIAINASDKFGTAKYRANIAATELALGNTNRSEKLYRQALEEAQEAGLYSVIWQCEEGLANVLEETGRYEEALYHFKNYRSIKDSLFNVEKDEIIQELEVRYQTEKKEQENKTLQQENAIIQLESSRNRTLLFGSIIGFVLLGLAGLLFYSRQKVKQQNKLQEELIKEREKGLKAMVDGTEEERKRIAKDLHDGIGQQLSGLKLAWQKLVSNIQPEKAGEKEKLEKLNFVLDDACSSLRTISHQMMPKALAQMGLVPAIDDMLKKSFDDSDISCHFDHFQAEGRFPEEIELSFYRIGQELIQNVIKHSQATEVNVQLFRNKQSLLMIVEDNGIGLKDSGEIDGIGLTNIRTRVNTIKGEFKLESGPEKGSVATVKARVE